MASSTSHKGQNNKEKLMANANETAVTKQQIHEKIRIPCTIGRRNYLACGFMKAGEPPVLGPTMLDRIQVEGTRPIDDEEWENFMNNFQDFSKYPELDPYCLVTERRSPGFPHRLSCISRGSKGRCRYSYSVGLRWHDGDLVLRRCP